MSLKYYVCTFLPFALTCMDIQNKTGNTALHAATYAHRRRSVTILLEGGADPTLYNNNCFNPILSAAKLGFYPYVMCDTTKLLILVHTYGW